MTKSKNKNLLEIKVSEMFPAIQGEGVTMGQPVYFVRLSGCNTQCPWCFGIKDFTNKRGFNKPRVYDTNSKKWISINEISKGSNILTFNDDNRLDTTEIKDVLTREVDNWLSVTINGKIKYYVTPEHPFFTSRGRINATDLKVGDNIISTNNRSIDKFNYKLNFDVNSKLIRPIPENLIPTFEQYFIDNHSILNLGGKNGNYKGNHRNFNILKFITSYSVYSKCLCCGVDDKLEVHHIDNNEENDLYLNLTLLCHKCHSIVHQRGYNFWILRKDKKDIGEEEIVYKTVTNIKIEKGKLKVFNLQCYPHNSYIIDKMQVHNCDSKYHIDGNQMNVMELVDILLKKKVKHVVFTGGEPMIQIKSLQVVMGHLTRLIPDIRIDLETNGSLYHPTMMNFHRVGCSPKVQQVFGINSKIGESYYKIAKFNNVFFKFVYDNKNKDWFEKFIKKVGIPKEKVWIMPEGITREEQIKKMPKVIEYCIKYGYNFSPRIQVMAYDIKRGV